MGLREADRHARALLKRVERMEVPNEIDEGAFISYRDRPVDFVRDKLAGSPESYQEDVLEACASHSRVAIRSGHGVGKTTTLAWVLLWWLLTRPFSRVLILAPAFERQIGRFLLPEVRKWARRAPEPLPLTVGTLTVEVDGFGREWFALGVAASDPDTVEGGHAESICILGDEAKGLSADVIAALHGTQTDVDGDRLYLLASVPGGPSGPFYDAFRKGSWKTFHVSSADSARVSDEWVEQRREEWGEHSPLFQARVLGNFPEEAEGTLFPLSLLEEAIGRVPEVERPVMSTGLDCAEFGEDWSVLVRWASRVLDRLVVYKEGLDPVQLAIWAAGYLNQWGKPRVEVDATGVGSGTQAKLRELGHDAARVMAAASAVEPGLFARLNAEMAWKLREALQREDVGIAKNLPNLDRLLAELSAYRYGFDQTGRIRLLKDETKKMLGHSPDLADAAILGFGGAAAARRGLDYRYLTQMGDELEDGEQQSLVNWLDVRLGKAHYR